MGCKICIPHKNDIEIKCIEKKSDEINSELDLINKIIEKRNQLLNIKAISALVAERTEDTIYNDFIEDVNNEIKLCNYLDKLKKNQDTINKSNKKYQYILFLYFDVLSTENKKKYTKLDFNPSIEEFIKLIQSVKNNTFKKEDFSSGISDRKKLIDEKIITIFPYISELIEEEKKTKDNKKTNEIQLEIENILNDRIISKNTLANPELYFQTLINIYLEAFSPENNNDIDEKNNINKEYDSKDISSRQNLYFIYQHIINCIDAIKKNKNQFSIEEENYFLLIFFGPIIGKKLKHLSFFNIKKHKEEDIDFKFIIKGQKLLVENKLKQLILEFPDYNAISKDLIIKNYKARVESNVEINDYLMINCVNPQYFQKYNFYNYKAKNWEFNTKLLKHILKSTTIKSLMDYLRPELKDINVFNDYIINEIFNNTIFVPYELSNAYGATSKVFFKIFINGLSPKTIYPETILNSSSSFQIINIHEICGHWICCYISFKLKNSSLYNSVCYQNYKVVEYEKKIEEFGLENSDGGEIIEKILFSRVMDYTTIKEMLFILCKNSYNDDFKTFKNNFKNIKNIDLESLYYQVTKDSDLLNYLDFLNINLKYLKKLEKTDFNLKYKRNGEIKKSTCGTKLISA